MDGLNANFNLDRFDCIYLGFSGGLDSRVLLDLLCQEESVKKKLRVVHVNHGISPHALDWEMWTTQLCESLGLALQHFRLDLGTSSNLEETARNERYAIFNTLVKSSREVLLLAHHQNDQAETVLLRLFRGAGIEGLAAMSEYRSLGQGMIYRPLLHVSRAELECYAREKKLAWIEDESNADRHFDRNFLRHEIIPLLEKRWPAVVRNLSRSAQHCRDASLQLHEMMQDVLKNSVDEKQRLNISQLESLPYLKKKLLLRQWLQQQDFKKPSQDTIKRILEEVVLAVEDAKPIVAWKEGEVRRYDGWLYALKKNTFQKKSGSDSVFFSRLLAPFVKGAASDREARDFQAGLKRIGKKIPPNPPLKKGGIGEKVLLKREGIEPKSSLAVTKTFEIRFRQGGEKIRLNGKTRELKKLFQEWKIPPWERDQIPLLFLNGRLVGVIGWAVSDDIL